MEKKDEVLEITTTSRNFFYEYLLLKKPVLEVILSKVNKKKIKLSPKILKVFSILLYYNSINQNEIINDRIREEIMKEIDINQSHLNTYISILRSIKLLNGNNINKPFVVYPNTGFELVFKFTINGHEE